MELVQTLAPIASRACFADDVDEQTKGIFLRMLAQSADLTQQQSLQLFETIVEQLVESNLLESAEFHEGLSGLISSNDLMHLLIHAYPSESGEKLGSVVVTLFSVGHLKPDYYGWHELRQSMEKAECRTMLVKLMEESFDRINQIPKFLRVVFEDESDDFDVCETIRQVLETNWIMDIIPTSRKAARRSLEDHIVHAFPFAKKVVDDFVQEALRLDPLVVLVDNKDQDDKSVKESSDSEIESAGSLEDFVVNESDGDGTNSNSDDESDSSSLVSSNYSDNDESPQAKKKQRKKIESSDDDSSSSSGYSS